MLIIVVAKYILSDNERLQQIIMNKPLILKKLKKFGLSPYESKSYLSLLERDSLTVAEVAKLAGIPRPSVYEALEKLLAKGLCQSRPGDTKKYSASDPELFKEKYNKQTIEAISEVNDEFDRKEAEIIEKYEREKKRRLEKLRIEKAKLIEKRKTATETILKVTEELKPYYAQSRAKDDPLEYIEILKNPNQIHRKFIELMSKTQKEVLGFSKPPFSPTTSEQQEEQVRVQFEAADRKVIQRAIIQMPPEDEAKEYFDKMLSVDYDGTEFDKNKVIDELPVKLFVFDEKVCFFALEDPIKTKTSLTMLVAKHEAMAKSFKFLFESFWEKAHDYYIIKGQKYYLNPEDEKKQKRDDNA